MHSFASAQAPAVFDAALYLRSTGAEFKRARLERGLSREVLAECAAVHPNSVAVAERGSHDLSGMTKIRIYAALGIRCLEIELNRDIIVLDGSSGHAPDGDILGMSLAAIAADIGSAIRAYREGLGFRLEDVAAASGLHLNTLWNIERGLVKASGVSLHSIYIALGVRRLSVRERSLRLS